MKTVKLNFGELNELNFSYSIKGTTLEKLDSEKNFQFFLIDEENNKHVFPIESLDSGRMKVSIPASSELKENTEYRGVLEVTVGTRIFHPLTIPIVFESTKIEVQLLSETPDNTKEEIDFYEFNEAVLKQALFSEKKEPPKPIKMEVKPPVQKASPQKEYLKNLIFEAWKDF